MLVAVAAGARAVESLEARAAGIRAGALSLIRHDDLAVAWRSDSPWVTSHDDGDVLAVLDGRLHDVDARITDQAHLLLDRYRTRGADVARGLLGDFVIVVLDRSSGSLVVARDPVGVRPWHVASAGRDHAGATDLATLVSLPWVNTDLDEAKALEYLAAVEESRGPTFYTGVRTLGPGQTWKVQGHRSTTLSHHSWRVEPELDLSWDEAAERCRSVLDEAITARTAGAAPTSELSGGLDSSTVVGSLVRMGADDLVVGRLLFDRPSADERNYSDVVIRHWGLRDVVSAAPWIPTPEETSALLRSLRRPAPDPNFTMFVGLHRAFAARGRASHLTGIGGDDAFDAVAVGPRVMSALQLRQRDVLATVLRSALRHPRQSWGDMVRPTLGYLVAPRRPARLPRWISPVAAARTGLSETLRRRPQRVTGVLAIDARLDSVTGGYDAAILETQALVADLGGHRPSHPFLDPRLVEATYGFDPWWPVAGGGYRALQRDAYATRLPPALRLRSTKAEFSEVFWPQVLDDERLGQIRNGPLEERGWLDVDGFDVLVERAKRGMANSAIPLFRCVSLHRWLRGG